MRLVFLPLFIAGHVNSGQHILHGDLRGTVQVHLSLKASPIHIADEHELSISR
jgi:hypothetical protein